MKKSEPPYTSMVEFTVRFEAEDIAVAYEYCREPAALLPVAALMHLLAYYEEHVSPQRILSSLEDHPEFQAALNEYILPAAAE